MIKLMIDGIITDKILDWKSLNIKHGGYLLVICKKRYHKITCDIENSGYEIRDMILYLPNTMITVARKPLSEKTIIENVLKYGTSGINIDSCRIKLQENDSNYRLNAKNHNKTKGINICQKGMSTNANVSTSDKGYHNLKGRFPTNIILDGSEEIEKIFPYTKSGGFIRTKKDIVKSRVSFKTKTLEGTNKNTANSEGSASRFFYKAKTYQDLIKYLEILITPPKGKICII